MTLVLKAKEREFEPVSAGLHPAVCVGLIDLGEQYSQTYDKYQPKIRIIWEVLDEKTGEGETAVAKTIGKDYTASMDEKSTLRAQLKSWRGRDFTPEELQGFDLQNILGAPCQIQVLEKISGNNRAYMVVDAIVTYPKGLPKPVPSGEITVFTFDDENWPEKLAKLPQWLQDRIKESKTYQGFAGGDDGDKPF